jgi:hypothetical protein
LYDYWDKEKAAAVYRDFPKRLKPKQTFEIDGVSYFVCSTRRNPTGSISAVVRMVRYRISDTATQVVHKCPALRDPQAKLSKEDVVKLDAVPAKKRVRTSAYNQLEHRCPHCGVVFYKSFNRIPETVLIPRVYKKRKR